MMIIIIMSSFIYRELNILRRADGTQTKHVLVSARMSAVTANAELVSQPADCSIFWLRPLPSAKCCFYPSDDKTAGLSRPEMSSAPQ